MSYQESGYANDDGQRCPSCSARVWSNERDGYCPACAAGNVKTRESFRREVKEVAPPPAAGPGKPCPDCDGTGWFDSYWRGYLRFPIPPGPTREVCLNCLGTGVQS